MQRPYFLESIGFHYKVHSVVGLLGPRQVGKTTLAKEYAKKYQSVRHIDLENPHELARLESPMLTLSSIDSELIIIDEIQRRPELFPILRVLVDERPRKFLILGSASRDLLKQSSETLAGRIGYIELPPFALNECKESSILWLRGGFPRSYLAETNEASYVWRQSYISTFVERDVLGLGFDIPPLQIRRLWMMLAHYHGNIMNFSEIGKSLGISHHTVKRYLDILAGAFMIRILQPWFENISKRQIKSPKVYIKDSGLLHALLGINHREGLLVHPKLGSSWEGFALEEIIKYYHATADECFFWATQGGAELDLLLIKDGKRIGFEVKFSDYPKVTQSMRIALSDLNLDHLYVVYPHKDVFPMGDKITALGLDSLYNN